MGPGSQQLATQPAAWRGLSTQQPREQRAALGVASCRQLQGVLYITGQKMGRWCPRTPLSYRQVITVGGKPTPNVTSMGELKQKILQKASLCLEGKGSFRWLFAVTSVSV